MKLKGKSIEVYVCKNCNEIVLPEDMDGECSDCGFFDTLVLTKLSLENKERGVYLMVKRCKARTHVGLNPGSRCKKAAVLLGYCNAHYSLLCCNKKWNPDTRRYEIIK